MLSIAAPGPSLPRATIANPDRLLPPGQYVLVRLHLTERPDATRAATVLGSSQLGSSSTSSARVTGWSSASSHPATPMTSLVVIDKGVQEDDTVIVGHL
jgi:hypothetical protein